MAQFLLVVPRNPIIEIFIIPIKQFRTHINVSIISYCSILLHCVDLTLCL
jgi:hypothetical protein